MGAFVIGHNIAGYLTEGDTHAYATFPEALDAFENMCREYASDDDETNDSKAESDWSDEDYGSMEADVRSVIADRDHLGLDGKSAGMVIGNHRDQDISFWLQWEPTREPDTTE